ncbi:gliding motility-associated C-terminal domain-containing protein [Mucilaginibacter sp. RT5R15]|nr:gliding motility-associated C-terminal domain-containing protein [Mucilaginibacter flavidus]
MAPGRLQSTFICLIILVFLQVSSDATILRLKNCKKAIHQKTAKKKKPGFVATTIPYSQANCNDINWASWGSFTGASATGTINDANGSLVNVTMTSNFDFGSTPGIYNYSKFSTYPSPIPDAQVPETTWSKGAGGTTTMCFSKTVTNPVLLIASLGSSAGISSKLDFSLPYVVLFDGGNMVYNSSTSLTGTEGYAIIMFPGDFTCVTINSTTEEFYTNITWGLRPPPFPININEGTNSCGKVVLTADGGVTYLWNDGDTPDKATNTFHQSGTYIVTVTNSAGCTTSASKIVTVNPDGSPPVISQTASSCGSITLTASGGVSYLWDGGDTPGSPTNTFRQNGTYTVTTTSAGGCIASASKTVTIAAPPVPVISGNTTGCGSLTLTAGGGASYSWDGGDTPGQPANTFHQSGTYTVLVTDANGCSASKSTTITVNPDAAAPVISVTASTCGSVTLTATGGTSYLWDGGDTPDKQTNTFHQSGTYTVNATNAGGCTMPASKTITVDVPPILTISGNTTDCGGVTLTAGSGAASYAWDGGDTPGSPANTFHTSGTYNVLATYANSCTATAAVTVTVNPAVSPSVNISASPSTAVCSGTPVSFTAGAVNGGNSPLLQWYKNNIPVATSATYTVTDPLNNDIIECNLTSNALCATRSVVSSNTITLVVNAIPTISISQEVIVNGSDPVRINPIITGDIAKYQWTPTAGLDDPTVPNPLAAPDYTTTYKLTVTTATGCEASALVTVKVLKNEIVIPNTFTPNGDGINDTWDITYLSDYKDATIDIYNRWGQHLFHSIGYSKAWDGTYNSKRLPAGTYYYVIDLKYNNYKRRSGWVAILK